MSLSLEQKLEGLLFYFGDAVTLSTLSDHLECSESETQEAIKQLETSLQERGLRLIVQNDKVTLGTHPDISDIITRIRKKELEGDLSKAAQEVLSVVLYAGPISKGYIDYIRGVNSTVSIRNLVTRGLIEKKEGGTRSQYVVTGDFLMSLGVTEANAIESYAEIRNKLEASIQAPAKE